MPSVGKEDPPPLLMDRYQMGKLLGKGSFAKVYQARNIASGEEVAIKVMDKEHLAKSGAAQQQIMSEIDVMRRVRHPNVVRLHEVMANKRRIFVVMELVRGGSLLDYLAKGKGVGEGSARRVFQQLVSALEYCHSRGVYHRDIKPENILVDDGKQSIKVADFGLSALADTRRQHALLHTVCGRGAHAPGLRRRHGRRLGLRHRPLPARHRPPALLLQLGQPRPVPHHLPLRLPVPAVLRRQPRPPRPPTPLPGPGAPDQHTADQAERVVQKGIQGDQLLHRQRRTPTQPPRVRRLGLRRRRLSRLVGGAVVAGGGRWQWQPHAHLRVGALADVPGTEGPAAHAPSQERQRVRHHRVLAELRPVGAVRRAGRADALRVRGARAQDHRQAAGDRGPGQLHGSHQGPPGQHRGHAERPQGRAHHLRQGVRAHAGPCLGQGVQEGRGHR